MLGISCYWWGISIFYIRYFFSIVFTIYSSANMSFDRCFHWSIQILQQQKNQITYAVIPMYRYYQLSLSISIFYICKSTFFRNPFFSSIFDSPACARHMQFKWKWSVKKNMRNPDWNEHSIRYHKKIFIETIAICLVDIYLVLTNKYSYFACRTYQRHGRYVCEPTLWK